MSESGQFEQAEPLFRRQMHYFYVTTMEKLGSAHDDALACAFSVSRCKLFDHASYPREGDAVTLNPDQIRLTKNWSNVTTSTLCIGGNATPTCPVFFPEGKVSGCLRLNAAHVEADGHLQDCRGVIGTGPEERVPLEQYDEIKQRESKLKADALQAAESEEERARLGERWIFDGFDEEEYS